MPNWFKKNKEDELPESLRDKTPEQVDKELKDAQALKARLDTLENERKTEKEQVASMTSSFNEVKAKLAATEANLNKLQNPPREDEPIDWNLEPEKAFRKEIQPLVNVTVNNAMMSARMLAIQSLDNEDSISPTDARTMNGRLFRAWESEINQEAQKYPAGSMGQPQNWLGIFFMVKGRHADELANPETRKKKYNFIESGAQHVDPPAPKPKDGVESLTDQEKHVADKMGVSYENYAKRKKTMQFVQG
jgi:hypothetical protein